MSQRSSLGAHALAPHMHHITTHSHHRHMSHHASFSRFGTISCAVRSPPTSAEMVKSLSTNGIAKRLSSVGNTLTHDERRESLTNLQKWIKANPRYVPTLWRLCVSGTVSLLEKQSHREMIPDCNNRYHSLSKTIKVKWLKKALGLDGSDYKKVEEKTAATSCSTTPCASTPTQTSRQTTSTS